MIQDADKGDLVNVSGVHLDDDAKRARLQSLINHEGARSYASALDYLGCVTIVDLDGVIVDANDELCRISQYARTDLVGKNLSVLATDMHGPRVQKKTIQYAATRKTWRGTLSCRRRDGEEFWTNASLAPITEEGNVIGCLLVQVDITETISLHNSVRERASQLNDVVESLPGGFALFNENRELVVCNQNLRKLINTSDKLVDPEQLADVQGKTTSAKPRGRFLSTYVDLTKNDSIAGVENHQGARDALTGLREHTVLRDELASALTGRSSNEKLAVIYLGVDRFKTINEQFGHATGDVLLKEIAKRICAITRSDDIVARVSGDEFAVVQRRTKNRVGVEALVKRLLKELSQPFSIDEKKIVIEVSAGVVMSPDKTTDPDELLRNADVALMRAKVDDFGGYSFFDVAIDSRQRAQRCLETDLRNALDRQQFRLHFQPLLSTAKRRIVGFEALLRWQHPEHGMVPAGEFIPLAEETGLIVPIGDWVMQKACQQALCWPEDVSIAVNVSAVQFRSRCLTDMVEKSLSGLDPSRLVIEVTESIFMQDACSSLNILRALREAGVQFALDDFGTGYSSLAYLQSFPFDKIKIDRSFVANATRDERSATLLATIVKMGRALGMNTVAEGVETEEQFDLVKSEGCEEVQGYLFAPPVSATKATKLLATWRPHRLTA